MYLLSSVITLVSYAGRNSDPFDAFPPFTGLESFEYFGIFDNEFVPDLFSFPDDERLYSENFAYSSGLVNTEASSSFFVPFQETLSDYPVEDNNSDPFIHSSNQASRGLHDNSTPTTAQSISAAISNTEQYGNLAQPQLPDLAPISPMFEGISSASPQDAPSSESLPNRDSMPPAMGVLACTHCDKAFSKVSTLR